jgi:methyl-accepting chemotaxis protein
VIKEFSEKTVKNSGYLWQIQRDIQAIEKDLLLAIASNDPKVVKEAIAASDAEREALVQNIELFKKNTRLDPSYMERFEQVLADGAAYRERIYVLSQQVTDASRDEALSIFLSHYKPNFEKGIDILEETSSAQQDLIDEQNHLAARTYRESIIAIISAMIAALLFIIVLTILISRSLVHPVRELQQAAGRLAQGDLKVTIDYESRDELGALSDAMRKAMEKFSLYVDEIAYAMGELSNNNFALRPLKERFTGDFSLIESSIEKLVFEMSMTITQLKQAADQVSSGSMQVAAGAQALAQGATEQASSVEELSASINEISTQVSNNAEHSAKANEMSIKAASAIRASNGQMQNLMAAMDAINHGSTEISKIIKTIEDIAFQTNILALNAAVEAARAGAAGKGFAVVADEVRNLAAKSAQAAQNTTKLIEGSVHSVREGVSLADSTARDLLGAVESVENTTALIADITKASNEQAAAITQITIGVEQISSVVHNNSATSEESAAASEELSSQASLLSDLVSKFQL